MATTTTLVVTSGGNAVTTVNSGSVVTLTATVTAGVTPIVAGQVNFCDATAAHCEDIHLVGMAQLTQTGTATFRFRPGAGSHSYKAVFNGTSKDAGSESGTLLLTVTGSSRTSTSLEQSGTAGNYALTATVHGVGGTSPTGLVSFLNSSNENAVLSSAALTAGGSGFNFVNAQNQAAGEGSSSVTAGDFNGDGIPDLAMASGAVLLGNDDGTFTEGPDLPSKVVYAGVVSSIVSRDFNGDGFLDLAIANTNNNNVTVLMGKGDGTFEATSTSPATDNAPVAIVASDFNRDGIPDLAVANEVSNTLTILLGNGDGTFAPLAPFATPVTGALPVAIVTSDFNGDGIPDLAVANQGSSMITVLFGVGDGTFETSPTSPTASGPGLVTADFNGDGIPDLATVGSLLLGDGNGNFATTALNYSFGFNSFAFVAVGDFNGDNNPDLAVVSDAAMLGEYVGILLGDGSGGFTSASYDGQTISIPVGRDGSTIAVADFNGDGLPDLAAPTIKANLSGNQVTVLLAMTQTATATTDGVAPAVATGVSQVVASYTGDSNYQASVSSAVSLTAALGTPTVTMTASPNPAIYGASITMTATVTGSGLAPTGTIIFNDGVKQIGSGTLNGSGLATFASNSLTLGAHTLTASYGGDANYQSVTSPASVLSVVPVGTATPSVTVIPSSSTITDQQSVTVTVHVAGGGGLTIPTGTVILSSNSYSAQETLVSGAASFIIAAGNLGNGNDTLTATYSGDAAYASSAGTATVTVAPVTISLAVPASVSPGASTTSAVTLSVGSTYSGTMNLKCMLAGSPTGAQSLPTCSLNPTSITVTPSETGTAVFTVNTAAGTSTTSLLNGWEFSGGGVLAALLMIITPAMRRRWISLLALLLIVISAGAIGCGGKTSNSAPPITSNTPATTAGNYTFTVTAVDSKNSAITTSTNITVTVQ